MTSLPEPRVSLSPTRSQGLVDVLDRILDKGLVVAGDIRINLANVELLTIQVRLLICSIDKATEIGLTWWKTDPLLAGDSADAKRIQEENRELRERVRSLEARMERLSPGAERGGKTSKRSRGEQGERRERGDG